jgi:hypothetical protein
MEVRHVEGYGRCAIATSEFLPGQDVLKEFPLITWLSQPDSETHALVSLIESVNVFFASEEDVHAVDTDAVLVLPAFLRADAETKQEYVDCFSFFL